MKLARLALLASTLAFVACAPAGEDADDETEDFSPESDDAPGAAEPQGSVASSLASGVRIETHFTNPRKPNTPPAPDAAPDQDMAILDDLVRMIDDTPAGESIDIAVHSITVNKVQRAILRAVGNRVKVRVVHNGEDWKSEDETPKALAKALGDRHRWCGNVTSGGEVGGCISNAKSSIMHSKLALFSKTKDGTGKLQSWVSWFGSANLTYATGAKSFNNTVTVYGDRTLYEQFEKGYFVKLWNQTHAPGNDFLEGDEKRGTFASAASSTTVFASPNQNADVVLGRLAAIEPGKDCRIRTSQSMIFDSRSEVVDRLIALKKDGCKVWVGGNHVHDAQLAKLKRAGIPVHKTKTHDKLVLVNARYNGSTQPRKIAFTGSHNLTQSANSTNDELFVKIEDGKTYDALLGHFNASYNFGPKL